MSSPDKLSHARICEMAIDILRLTQDGDLLSPDDLALVEYAVNGELRLPGIELFESLYQNATKPEGYTRPNLFAMEHLTIDHERYVRWRSRVVEHFDHGFWRQPGWRERMRADAEALASFCRGLEFQGIEPTAVTVRGWLSSVQKRAEERANG